MLTGLGEHRVDACESAVTRSRWRRLRVYAFLFSGLPSLAVAYQLPDNTSVLIKLTLCVTAFVGYMMIVEIVLRLLGTCADIFRLRIPGFVSRASIFLGKESSVAGTWHASKSFEQLQAVDRTARVTASLAMPFWMSVSVPFLVVYRDMWYVYAGPLFLIIFELMSIVIGTDISRRAVAISPSKVIITSPFGTSSTQYELADCVVVGRSVPALHGAHNANTRRARADIAIAGGNDKPVVFRVSGTEADELLRIWNAGATRETKEN